ncbi:MAG: phosphoribosyltransferase [Dehalococcoidia bacterium]|nr:phosphoribosyltransferase [Dehalococcoidia bacterium]MSQ36555.1 phosphoribosyltransferase [Dehalococcoidia bacterium]
MGAGPGEPNGRLWLAELLWRLGGVQFGDFTLGRTVRNSPVYVNPKLLIARPEALAHVASLLADELQLALVRRNRPVEQFELIAGVPIGGLHVATALSLRMGVPLLYARPDRPEDERPQIEGIYRPGQTALIVDDLATGGGSLVATVERLRRAGLHVRDAAVLITREQGARARLESLGVRLHPLLSVEVLLTYLHGAERIPDEEYRRALQYLHQEGDARPPLP